MSPFPPAAGPLAVPWRTDGCAVILSGDDDGPVVIADARTPEIAERIAATHNAELIRWKAALGEARERREKRLRSPWVRLQHAVHARRHPELHREFCSACKEAA